MLCRRSLRENLLDIKVNFSHMKLQWLLWISHYFERDACSLELMFFSCEKNFFNFLFSDGNFLAWHHSSPPAKYLFLPVLCRVENW